MPKGKEFVKDTIITAILVDGGFYRRRAYARLGDKLVLCQDFGQLKCKNYL